MIKILLQNQKNRIQLKKFTNFLTSINFSQNYLFTSHSNNTDVSDDKDIEYKKKMKMIDYELKNNPEFDKSFP